MKHNLALVSLSCSLACGGQTPHASAASPGAVESASLTSTADASNASTPAPLVDATLVPARYPPSSACIPRGGPAITFERSGANVELRVTHERPPAWHHADLPSDYPHLSGLPSDWAPSAERTSVITVAGILVAVNDGEGADSGLYWLEKGSKVPQRVTTSGAENVRWVFSTTFGIVGVAGLCHGSCPMQTSLVKLTPTRHFKSWKLKSLAQLTGCPSALSLANSDTLFVASACAGTLTRIDRKGVSVIAHWPEHYTPVEMTVTSISPVSPSKPEPNVAHYVSFGRIAAKFTANTTEWFTPNTCEQVFEDEQGCHCQ